MSKTVDDLIAIYDAARKGAPIMGDMRRAGIAAVVRAVAPDDDEIVAYNRLSWKVQEQLKCECEYLPEDRCIRCSVVDALKCPETRYYEILGDAGNEKVAGGTSVHSREAGYQTRPVEPNPATDPAPAVCVWADVGDKYRSACGRSHFAWTSRDGVVVCPHCKAPIKFTEEK